ncbi:hypothetical protein U9M48_002827 [Paspalum notatum var. saurae]|uniref:Uncharacterized protein n=1 Tax=Paspalum notatum var. saurae TaxID=547442 RepID=A0AAQ3PRT0_PASNO
MGDELTAVGQRQRVRVGAPGRRARHEDEQLRPQPQQHLPHRLVSSGTLELLGQHHALLHRRGFVEIPAAVEPRGHQPAPAVRGGAAALEEAVELRPDALVRLVRPGLVVRQEPRLVGHKVGAVPGQRHGGMACGRQRAALLGVVVVLRLQQHRRQVPHQDHRGGAPAVVTRPLEVLERPEGAAAAIAAPQRLPSIAEREPAAAVKHALEDLGDGLLGLGGDDGVGEADEAPLEEAGDEHPDPPRVELVDFEQGELVDLDDGAGAFLDPQRSLDGLAHVGPLPERRAGGVVAEHGGEVPVGEHVLHELVDLDGEEGEREEEGDDEVGGGEHHADEERDLVDEAPVLEDHVGRQLHEAAEEVDQHVEHVAVAGDEHHGDAVEEDEEDGEGEVGGEQPGLGQRQRDDGLVVLVQEGELLLHHVEGPLRAELLQEAEAHQVARLLRAGLHHGVPLHLSPQQLEEGQAQARVLQIVPATLVVLEHRVRLGEMPDRADADELRGRRLRRRLVNGRRLHLCLHKHAVLLQVATLVGEEDVDPREPESAGRLLAFQPALPHHHVVARTQDLQSIITVIFIGGSSEMLLFGADEVRHVAGDEAGVPGEVEGALGELDAGGPLAELGDAEDPEDDEEGLGDGRVHVGVDEVADPHHARRLLDGVEEGVAPHAAREGVALGGHHGVHLLAEELHQEHPEEDEVGARGGALGAGLGVHVGHEGQEEREGGAEEDARRHGVAAVPAGEPRQQAQREQRGAEDGHQHRRGHHQTLGGAQVARHREVGHQRGRRRGAPVLFRSSGKRTVELLSGAAPADARLYNSSAAMAAACCLLPAACWGVDRAAVPRSATHRTAFANLYVIYCYYQHIYIVAESSQHDGNKQRKPGLDAGIRICFVYLLRMLLLPSDQTRNACTRHGTS